MIKNFLSLFCVLTLSQVSLAAPTAGTISVTGECQRKLQPDRGMIELTVVVLTKTATESSTKAAQIYEATKSEVKKLNLKDLELQTSNYQVFEKMEWEKDHNVSKGFEADMTLQVSTSEISRLGEVMSVAAKNNIKSVGNLQTFLSAEKSHQEYNSCLEEAIKNARSKAEKMASAASTKVGDVLAIEEGIAVAPRPVPFRMMAKNVSGEMSSSSPEVDTKSQNFSVNVSVMFKLK